MQKWEGLFGLTQRKLRNGLREIACKRRIGWSQIGHKREKPKKPPKR